MANGKKIDDSSQPSNRGWSGTWTGDFGKKILVTLVGVLLVYLIFLVGTLVHNNIKQYSFIGQLGQAERTITVNGYGKVNGRNDIAVTSIGFSNVDIDVAKAQAANKKVMDGVLLELKNLAIADKDLESNYTIYPEYDFTSDLERGDAKGREFKGYRVTNNITVKIRELAKISAVLGLAGKFGATQIGGLSFTIDDPENLKDQARQKALQNAQAKAAELASLLGVRLAAVVAYNEYDAGYGGPYPMLRADGLGGNEALSAPSIATGSQDVAMNVSITYKILP